MKQHLIALIFCAVVVGSLAPAAAQTTQPATPTKLFLPSLRNGSPPPTVFGVEAAGLDTPGDTAALAALGPSWLRRNGLRWSEIEPVEGAGYRWNGPTTAALEADMIRASRLGLTTIMIVHRSPPWALPAGSGSCGPILPAKHEDFARFLGAVVARYSQPPYNVRYWEIGNEPDAPLVPNDSPFGCWGDPADPYYGGRAYGELLKVAYAAVKAANPDAQVLNGGLLLDRPYDPARGTGLSGRFLEGVLEAGAGNAFDLVSYHSYTFYDGDPDGSLGPSDWKPAYLRELLRRYGLSKPLINTETALLCTQASLACTQAQAYAVPRLYARGLRDDLRGLVWYVFDSDSFRNTALVEPLSPSTTRPAYAAFAHARAMFGTARFVSAVGGLPAGVEGYRFASGKQVTLVIWSNTPAVVNLSIGAVSGLSCTEWNGAALPCSSAGGVVRLEARPGARYVSYQAP